MQQRKVKEKKENLGKTTTQHMKGARLSVVVIRLLQPHQLRL